MIMDNGFQINLPGENRQQRLPMNSTAPYNLDSLHIKDLSSFVFERDLSTNQVCAEYTTLSADDVRVYHGGDGRAMPCQKLSFSWFGCADGRTDERTPINTN